MKRFLFAAVIALGMFGLTSNVFAQDEPGGGNPDEVGDQADPGEANGQSAPDGNGAGDGAASGEDRSDTDGAGGGGMAAAGPKKVRFGVVGVLSIPLSPEEYTDFVGIGIGVLGGAMYPLSPKMTLAAHIGIVYHIPKEFFGVDVTFMEFPILGGVRYMATPQVAVGADTGLNIMRVSADTPDSDPDSETRIPLSLHGTYMMPNGVAVGGGLWIPNFLNRDSDADEDMWISLFGFVGKTF